MRQGLIIKSGLEIPYDIFFIFSRFEELDICKSLIKDDDDKIHNYIGTLHKDFKMTFSYNIGFYQLKLIQYSL